MWCRGRVVSFSNLNFFSSHLICVREWCQRRWWDSGDHPASADGQATSWIPDGIQEELQALLKLRVRRGTLCARSRHLLNGLFLNKNCTHKRVAEYKPRGGKSGKPMAKYVLAAKGGVRTMWKHRAKLKSSRKKENKYLLVTRPVLWQPTTATLPHSRQCIREQLHQMRLQLLRQPQPPPLHHPPTQTRSLFKENRGTAKSSNFGNRPTTTRLDLFCLHGCQFTTVAD